MEVEEDLENVPHQSASQSSQEDGEIFEDDDFLPVEEPVPRDPSMEGGHVFTTEDARALLKNKHLVYMGDSIQRGVYKDFVCLLQQDRLLKNDNTELKAKAEDSFMGDRLTYRTELTNGHDFTESREWTDEKGYHILEYYFVTRCYNERIEQLISFWEQDETDEKPDVIIMNSMLWDITRYEDEEHGDFNMKLKEKLYLENIKRLCMRLRQALPPSSMFIWTTTLPLASKIRPVGFPPEDIEDAELWLRVAILEFNAKVAQIVMSYGFDVLDLQYYFRPQIYNREPDGVHWNENAHRHMTELLLLFMHDSWGAPLPIGVRNKIANFPPLDLKHFYDGAPAFADEEELDEDGVCPVRELGEIADLMPQEEYIEGEEQMLDDEDAEIQQGVDAGEYELVPEDQRKLKMVVVVDKEGEGAEGEVGEGGEVVPKQGEEGTEEKTEGEDENEEKDDVDDDDDDDDDEESTSNSKDSNEENLEPEPEVNMDETESEESEEVQQNLDAVD